MRWSKHRGTCTRSATQKGLFLHNGLLYASSALHGCPTNTATALARYQGLAFGPVSRTVRTLISKGLLQKAGSAGPSRSEAVDLTMPGHDLLAKDPLRLVVTVCDSLSEKERACLAHALTAITSAVVKRDRT